MPRFSRQSKEKLNSCESLIILIMEEAIKYFDFTVLWGHRLEEEQNEAYNEGFSKKKWPESMHNSYPSKAIDIAPYPINWKDRERFTYLAGLIIGISKTLNINLRWGGDWDRDTQVKDNKFDDLCHFEIY